MVFKILKYKNTKCEYKYGVYIYEYDIISPDLEIIRYNIIKKYNIINKVCDNITENKNTLDSIVPDKYFEELKNTYENNGIVKKSFNVKWNGEYLSYNNNRIKVNPKLYHKICNHLIIKLPANIDMNTIIWCILYRYNYLGLLNMVQLANDSTYYNNLIKKYDACLELFASVMNHNLKYYCSLFYDLEKYFGSRGNHFNLQITKGFYLLNPPFTEDIINRSIDNILNVINENKNVGVFISIPIWDKEGRLWVNKNCKIKVKLNFPDVPLIKKILDNKNLIWHKKYCKENYRYFDYLSFTHINAAPTYLFLLNN